MPPFGEAQILEAVASGDQTASDIAQRAGMSILELARIVTTPRNLEALARVKHLHAIQREMLLGRLKRDALVRLAELTDEVPAGSADEVRAFEVMRKACVDILRFGNGHTRSEGREGPGSGGHRRESIIPASEAEVLEALERLGQEDEEQEEEYPQIEDSPGRITQIEDSPGRIAQIEDSTRRMNRGGFKSKSGSENEYEPRAQASGSVMPPPTETTIRTGKPPGPPRRMPMPLESTPPPESTPVSPPEVMDTRTGGTPMPPKIRNTPNRTPNTYNRILADDAHPP